MNVLVACEFSGVVREAFRALGHHAVSCDIIDSEPYNVHHFTQNVETLLHEDWDLVIAHPPCTYLCNSGVRWLKTEPDRWEKMQTGAKFFKQFLKLHHVEKVCIENPIMHGYAMKEIGDVKYTQIIQPWQFGHGETKATCLWLKGLPPLVPTNIVSGRRGKMHSISPGPDRGKLRSITYAGVAAAMAEQWGAL